MHQGYRHYGDITRIRKRPVLRGSSFGGESYHGSSNANTVKLQHEQASKHRYSVGDGHFYGAHSGEYFGKESNWPNQRHRRANRK